MRTFFVIESHTDLWTMPKITTTDKTLWEECPAKRHPNVSNLFVDTRHAIRSCLGWGRGTYFELWIFAQYYRKYTEYVRISRWYYIKLSIIHYCIIYNSKLLIIAHIGFSGIDVSGTFRNYAAFPAGVAGRREKFTKFCVLKYEPPKEHWHSSTLVVCCHRCWCDCCNIWRDFFQDLRLSPKVSPASCLGLKRKQRRAAHCWQRFQSTLC